MESEVTHSADLLKLWAWFEKNKKQAITGVLIALVLGLVIWFIVWRQGEKALEAGSALSSVFVPQAVMATGGKTESPDAYLKVAANYAGSKAAEEALLLAAGSLFTEGKYADAQAQFEKFKREHGSSPLIGPALLGIAACLEAQGKTAEATAAYKDIVDHHPGEAVVLQAKFALGRLYETQNKPDQALVQYEDVVRNDPYGGSMGNEAALRAEELKAKFPTLAAKAPAVPAAPKATVAPKAPAPAPAPANTAAPGNTKAAPAPTPKH